MATNTLLKASGNTLFFFAVLLTSCMRSTSLTVLQPAQMKLPEHISKVAIIDRSKPSNGWLNALEGLLTGEAIGQDRRSRQEAVAGLTNALTRTPRFEVVSTGIEMEGSKAGVNLPPALPWSQIEQICADFGTNAVAAIESFDSDNSISTHRNDERKKDKDGKYYTVTTYDARQRTGVRIGWRLYDPKTKTIIDEYVTDDYLERTARGNTDRESRNRLPSQVTVSRDVAFNVGIEYGARIAPIYVNLNRQYYAKAKGFSTQMEKAARFAQGQDWDRAAGIWKTITEQPGGDRKAAGRAAYNMAVAAEVKGNLDLALEWAQKAWNDYGNKKARNYINILKQRQNDAARVEYQMPGKRV